MQKAALNRHPRAIQATHQAPPASSDEYKLTVHPEFFTEFAERQWKSSVETVKELVENSYDADSSRVLITFLSSGVVIEDDAGMSEEALSKFLQVGGRHQAQEWTAKGRKVIGKYRVGRLSALGAFNLMRVRTKMEDHVAGFEFSYDDLVRLAAGSTSIRKVGMRPLSRNGSEVMLQKPKSMPEYDAVVQELVQMPMLRTPGFEVYVKRSDRFQEWDFQGADRVYPKDIPGVKIPVKLEGIEGVITIADDVALPLAEEDRGIGIVVSQHLVTRTYFGFENSEHRFDRVTGYVEDDRLRTTFGTKDRLIEDDAYRTFLEAMVGMIKEKVLPKLKDAEVKRVGRTEMKLLRRVDRILGRALLESPLQLLDEQKVPPKLIRVSMRDSVIRQTKETSIVMISSTEVVAITESNLESIQPIPLENIEAAADAEPKASADVGTGVQSADPSRTVDGAGNQGPDRLLAQAQTQRPEQKKVAHYLHDLGVVILFNDDPKDDRPSYGDPHFNLHGLQVKAIFINKEHPAYKRSSKRGLLEHLIRLITNELAAMRFEDGTPAIRAANKLYANAIMKL